MAIVQSKSAKIRVVLTHVFLIAFLLVTVFPLLMVVSISLREGNLAVGSLWPDPLTWEHWSLALGRPFTRADGTVVQPPFPVLVWLWNSIKVALLSAAGIVTLSTTAAYAFARLRFPLKRLTLNGLLIAQMFPAVLALVAFYTLFDRLGTYVPALGIDSLGAVVLANLGGITLHVWTIKGYFETIDRSMEEAAICDGATPFQAFYKVLLPMSVPILMVVFVLAFITAVVEYPIASVLLQSERNLTLAVGARLYLYEQNYLWGDFAAAALLSGLPITIVFLIAQRWLISGLTAGGVKG